MASPHEMLQQASEGLQKTKEVLTKPTDVEIVKRFLDHGIQDYISVACSITDTIDDMWQKLSEKGKINFIRTTHEHNLIGIAAGIYLATGRVSLIHMQNSGLTNAADGLISFARVYTIPILALVTWRGSNEKDDSEPHQEIGKRTERLTQTIFDDHVYGSKLGRGILRSIDETVEIAQGGGIAAVRLSPDGFTKIHKPSLSAKQVEVFSEEKYRRYKAMLESKGAASNPILEDEPISRDEALKRITSYHPNAAITPSNGFTARAMQTQADRIGNLYNVGYMGGTLAIGWAMARSNPDLEVVVIDGDQNAQMSNMKDHLADNYPENLYWYILNNGIGASVGTAKSLPLAPWYYELARVIPTIPDEPGTFPYPRVRDQGKYFDTDEARYMASQIGPLPYHRKRFMDWIPQQVQHNRAKASNVPFDGGLSQL